MSKTPLGAEQDFKQFVIETFFQYRSRSRRVQYDWIKRQAGHVRPQERTLDLGGVRNADYYSLLELNPDCVEVWNLTDKVRPHRLVDLDKVSELPPFPNNVTFVVALNLLEHLFRPLELLAWVCRNLPPGGKLLLTTPFCYPVHASPNDYWRLTPQAYERFFHELEKDHGISGKLTVKPLAEDYRDGISLLTTPLFHAGKKSSRLTATVLEAAAGSGSRLASAVIGRDRLRKWAELNAPAIGVFWIKEARP